MRKRATERRSDEATRGRSGARATASTRYTVTFTGRVQGVGFRATTCRVAERYDVTGWVKNVLDGSVRCVTEGSREELDRFLASVQERMRGYIDETTVTPSEATGEFDGFTIRF